MLPPQAATGAPRASAHPQARHTNDPKSSGHQDSKRPGPRTLSSTCRALAEGFREPEAFKSTTSLTGPLLTVTQRRAEPGGLATCRGPRSPHCATLHPKVGTRNGLPTQRKLQGELHPQGQGGHPETHSRPKPPCPRSHPPTERMSQTRPLLRYLKPSAGASFPCPSPLSPASQPAQGQLQRALRSVPAPQPPQDASRL